jgi:ATP-dependent helicase/nuclease subunit B
LWAAGSSTHTGAGKLRDGSSPRQGPQEPVSSPGERRTDPFVRQLHDLCRAHRTRPKWILVPGHAVGHTLGERLAREGTSWASLRFTPPFDLALEMAAPFLVEQGIDPVPDGLGPALIARLLLDLPALTPRYFRPLAEQPGMGDALWRTLRELRMAGVTAVDLKPNVFEVPEKAAEYAALVRAYERHLAAERLADAPLVYQEALRRLEVCPIHPQDLIVELPGVLWSPLERRFLDALPGEHIPARALAAPGLGAPRRLTDLGSRVEPAPPPATPASDAERLAWLLRPESAPPPRGDGTTTLTRAGGREPEIEDALRRILAAGWPLDTVEIACASDEDATLIWEKAQRHDWSVTVESGVPSARTRPARALLGFLAWYEDGFRAGALRHLFQSGDIRLDLPDGPSPGQAARFLTRAGTLWGRETYGQTLRALAAELRERAEDPDVGDAARAAAATQAGQVERLAGVLDELLALAPEPERDGAISTRALLAGVRTFLDRFAAVGGSLDGGAVVVIRDALDELDAVGDLGRPRAAVLRLVRDRVDGLAVGGDRARPGCLHVAPLARAGYAGRTHTLVVGLEEGRVLPPLLEDPVLLDAERERLHPLLLRSADRVAESLHHVVGRLAVLGGTVGLSYSCRDLRESRETFPSWLVLQAFRLRQPGQPVTYEDLGRSLGEPVSAVPAAGDAALSDAGWWLASLRGARRGARAVVRSAFPALGLGAAAEAARDGDAFTEYDGWVPDAGPLLDPTTRVVSATTLEALAGCPFRHFLERGLGISAVDDAGPDPDAWLDPLTRGSLMHDLYARFGRERRSRGERLEPRHAARLCALGDEELRKLKAAMPPPSDHVFERERAAVIRDLNLLLDLETLEPGRTPVAFEVTFGSAPDDDEPLARAEPVTADLGPSLRLRLRGRIDRIDRLADGSYEVTDYKTGGCWPADRAGWFAGGRKLQHALYAIAAAELLRAADAGARVTRSSYYFPTVKGGGERVLRPPRPASALGQVLGDLVALVRAGAFLHTPSEDDCRFCDFGRACGPAPFERAARKLDQPANRALAAYRQLRGHV